MVSGAGHGNRAVAVLPAVYADAETADRFCAEFSYRNETAGTVRSCDAGSYGAKSVSDERAD